MRSAPPAPDGDTGSVFDWSWFLCWAIASSAWCLTAAAQLSATFDEPLYVARGLEGWRTGSHHGLLRLGTMPLPADLQTLPLHAVEIWRGIPFDPAAELERLLPAARAGTLLFWWLLLAYGRLAGRALAGSWGGRLAVALLACEPSLLAHAALATTDVALAACLLAFAYHASSGSSAAWLRRVGVPMAWFGASVLAKVSGLVMGLLCLTVIEIQRRWLRTDDAATGAAGGRSRRDIVSIVAGGLLIVVLYCGSDWRTEPSFVAWARQLPEELALRAPLVWGAEHLRIFSNAGEGVVRQIRHNIRGHGTFLLGATHARAVWYYFPVLLTIKLSEPLLFAVPLLAIVRRRALANWPLLVAGTLLLCSVTFRVQLGIRMVLPIVVFGAVGIAAALAEALQSAPTRARARMLAAVAGAALAWNMLTLLSLWPDALVYVNRLWGGQLAGYRLVSDSNYDWGQGLKELRQWQRAHADARLAVWYFGTDPLVARPPLRPVYLHRLPDADREVILGQLRGQLLAASTSLLYGGGIDGPSYRQALAVLHDRQPIDRTTTFLIYDFSAD
jgi:hypothetical protein